MASENSNLPGEPAARIGDRTDHEGMILSGEPTVLIEGAFAARVEDITVCPQHGVGRIVERSSDVLCGGRWLARRTAQCDCSAKAPTLSVVLTTDPLERSTSQQVADRGYGGPSASAVVEDKDGDGTYDSVRVEASTASIKTPYGSQIDVLTGSASERVNVTDKGGRVELSREVVGLKETASRQFGDVRVESTTRVFAAGANADGLLGYSGDERGVRARASIGASIADTATRVQAPASALTLLPQTAAVASVLQAMRSDPRVDALMKPFDVKVDVTASVGAGVGVEEGAWLVQDLSNCEVRAGALASAGIVGLEINVVSDAFKSCVGPNTVSSGAKTVRIGARK